jgi:hypothetical protein
VLEGIALFCGGSFFGAALYITLAQHPATLDAGAEMATRFFPPMYRRAATMQVVLALAGTGAALGAWLGGSGPVWAAGALTLFSVVPFTLIAIMPVNQELLAQGRDPKADGTEALLRRWGALHAVRSALSGIAFVMFLSARF